MIDIEQFEERAAIMEFDGGLSRFKAETLAAQHQGYRRDEVMHEIRQRNSEGSGDRSSPVARGQCAGSVPELQSSPKKET